MAAYSKHPVDIAEVRTFQSFRRRTCPATVLPTDSCPPEQAELLRLSSTSHRDVPVRIGHQAVHVLASYPTRLRRPRGRGPPGRGEPDPRLRSRRLQRPPRPGNLRADFVLPSTNLRVVGAGVWWPAPGGPGAELTGEYPFPTSDDRPVCVDVRVGGRR